MFYFIAKLNIKVNFTNKRKNKNLREMKKVIILEELYSLRSGALPATSYR